MTEKTIRNCWNDLKMRHRKKKFDPQLKEFGAYLFLISGRNILEL
jgi:hypothetical protein